MVDHITFDLDKQEIVDFRLKAWADQFLVLVCPENNEIICQRYIAGENISDLAREYGLSPQRVHQIVTLPQFGGHPNCPLD